MRTNRSSGLALSDENFHLPSSSVARGAETGRERGEWCLGTASLRLRCRWAVGSPGTLALCQRPHTESGYGSRASCLFIHFSKVRLGKLHGPARACLHTHTHTARSSRLRGFVMPPHGKAAQRGEHSWRHQLCPGAGSPAGGAPVS